MRLFFIAIFCFIVCGFTLTQPQAIPAIPKHFPKPQYDFTIHPFQQAQIALGRLLFYDPRLSGDSTVSCASCHSPYNAFAHTDHALSHGIGDSIGIRNAPALFNLAWQKAMMWDGAINHIELQALAPLQSSREMGSTLIAVLKQLNQDTWYKPYIQDAFGDTVLHGEHFLKALTQFQLSLISSESRYDSMLRKQIQFTQQEQHGYRLFQQHCASCHQEPLLSTYGFARNGLPMDTLLMDKGLAKTSGSENDLGKFKIPSLRNWQYTYPYMHDGRFKRIREVLHHYNSQGVSSGRALSLPDHAITDLLSFLYTVNDKHFVFDTTHTFPLILREQLTGANKH